MNKDILNSLNFNNVEMHEVTSACYENTDDNIVSVGYGFKKKNGLLTSEKCLVFGVEKKIKTEEIDSNKVIPEFLNINGNTVKTDVIEVVKIKPMACTGSFYDWQTVEPTNRTAIRPLKGGVSAINSTDLNGYACTLGFFAKDDLDGKTVGISNVHCAATQPFDPLTVNYDGVYVFNNIEQPSEGGGDHVGFVKRIKFLNTEASNLADVAVYSIFDSFLDSSSVCQQEGLSINSCLPFASAEEINNLLTSDPLLYSSGRTTGAKGEGNIKLRVDQININVNVGPYGGDKYATFAGCISFIATPENNRPFSEQCVFPINHGDSGSCLIADINGQKKIIGLVFAAGFDAEEKAFIAYANNIVSVSKAACISSLAT